MSPHLGNSIAVRLLLGLMANPAIDTNSGVPDVFAEPDRGRANTSGPPGVERPHWKFEFAGEFGRPEPFVPGIWFTHVMTIPA